MHRRVLGGLLALLCAAWLPIQTAVADESIAWTVAAGDDGTGRPNFAYEVSPGQVVEDTWVVANAGTEPVTLQVYAADAFTTTSGQLDLSPTEEPPTGVGAWTHTSVSSLTLRPAQQSVVSFSVTVPADTAPGDYAGGLVTSMVDGQQKQVEIERRLATRIHVRVPGDLTTAWSASGLVATASAAINPFAPVALQASYQALNVGTARSYARETLMVVSPFGLGRSSRNAEVAETLPGGELEQSLTLDGVWAIGPTTVSLELIPVDVDGNPGQPITATTTLWIVPWGWLGILVLVVGVAVTIGVIRSRRRWEWVDAPETASP